MGQVFSTYTRKGATRFRRKSADDVAMAANIDKAPHPNETLGLRVKWFGPTDVILVIKNNPSPEEGVASNNSSPTHHSPSLSSAYCRFYAHRDILCRRSKYFASMLRGPFLASKDVPSAEENSSLCEFPDKHREEVTLISIYKKTPAEMADLVGQVLHFAYFNQRALNPENVQTLLEAANYFQVQPQTNFCV